MQHISLPAILVRLKQRLGWFWNGLGFETVLNILCNEDAYLIYHPDQATDQATVHHKPPTTYTPVVPPAPSPTLLRSSCEGTTIACG